MITEKITILNPSGLHARPASDFAQITNHFKSTISIKKGPNFYNAKSILSVLSACIQYQDEIELQINGIDEVDALETIRSAIKKGLGETTQGRGVSL